MPGLRGRGNARAQRVALFIVNDEQRDIRAAGFPSLTNRLHHEDQPANAILSALALHCVITVAVRSSIPGRLGLVALLAASGGAALIYEIVWFQLLQLVIGSSAVSLGVLLGTFMGGMCLGSLLLPRLVPASRHPLRVYAWLELGIGLAGLAVLAGLPAVGRIYAQVGGHGWAALWLRALVAAVCLLPPTLLMGATLPAVARRSEEH